MTLNIRSVFTYSDQSKSKMEWMVDEDDRSWTRKLELLQ